MPTGSHRSPERIEMADLLRRAVLAAHAEAELFRYPFRPVAGVGLEVDAPVSVVMAGVLGDP